MVAVSEFIVSSYISKVPVTNEEVNEQQDLWVPRLDNKVTEIELFEFFNQVVPVLSVHIRRLRHIETADAFGTITFRNKKDAIQARDSLNSKCIHGKPLSIVLAGNNEGISNTNGCANVFVKNLDATIDSEYLREVFSSCGTILSCKVATDSIGRSKGYGYVQFKEEKDAKSAILDLNEIILRKKEIYVRPFVKKEVRDGIMEEKLRKTVFVRNVSEDVDRNLFISVFKRSGRVRYAGPKGCLFAPYRDVGFVTFEIEEEAARAVEELNGYIHNGSKPWKVERAWSEKSESKIKQGIGQVTNLYVKNIDKCINDEKLEELFSQFGRITSCKVILDSQGLSKGFGFVAFSTDEEASIAVKEMNGKMIGRNPKPLYVAVAQRKGERKSMLQARFTGASSQELVASVPSGTSASAPPFPAEQFQFGNQLGVGPDLVMQYQVPPLIPPNPQYQVPLFVRRVVLRNHKTNEGYMPKAPSQHVPTIYVYEDGRMVYSDMGTRTSTDI